MSCTCTYDSGTSYIYKGPDRFLERPSDGAFCVHKFGQNVPAPSWEEGMADSATGVHYIFGSHFAVRSLIGKIPIDCFKRTQI